MEMITGEKSGVAFSMSPKNRKEAIIESVYGLNQGMVDGTIEPDRWTLDRSSGKVISHYAVLRENAVTALESGTSIKTLEATPDLDRYTYTNHK